MSRRVLRSIRHCRARSCPAGGELRLERLGQRREPPDRVGLKEVVGVEQDVDEVVVAEDLVERLECLQRAVALDEPGLVGGVESQLIELRGQQCGCDRYGEEQQPAHANDSEPDPREEGGMHVTRR